MSGASHAQAASICRVAIQTSDVEGRWCAATEDTSAGDVQVAATSLAIAIEPACRDRYCGFCSRSGRFDLCGACGLIATCDRCRRIGAADLHAYECAGLAALADGEPEALSSIVLVAARLALRGRRERHEAFDALCTLCLEGEAMENFIAAGEGIAHALSGAAAGGAAALDGGAVTQVLLRCAANSHSLVDLDLPLGEQQIGLGVFPPLSYFNHSCAPSAYLSTQPSHTSPAVEGSVRALRPLAAGAAVTLSYIPLGGMPSCWRRARLKASYGFDCRCEACRWPVGEVLDGRMLGGCDAEGSEGQDAAAAAAAAAAAESSAAESAPPGLRARREAQAAAMEEGLAALAQMQQAAHGSVLEDRHRLCGAGGAGGGGERPRGAAAETEEAETEAEATIDGTLASLSTSETLVSSAVRGVRNLRLGQSHEMAIEGLRLQAALASLQRRWAESAEASRRWLEAARTLELPRGGGGSGGGGDSSSSGDSVSSGANGGGGGGGNGDGAEGSAAGVPPSLADPLAVAAQRRELASALLRLAEEADEAEEAEARARRAEAVAELAESSRLVELCTGGGHAHARLAAQQMRVAMALPGSGSKRQRVACQA